MSMNAQRDEVIAPTIAPETARAGPTYVRVPPRPFTDAVNRLVDVVGSAVLLVVFSPVLGITALAVRMTSKGPAFFWQDRYGKDEHYFKCVKLRTMVVDHAQVIDLARVEALEEQGVLTKSENDPRVTLIGKFLRRTSLDELPQLWNVLQGEMSLVGPRPLIPFMLKPYPELRAARCVVRPGITGLWQISARDDNTNALSMAKEDLEYIATRSVFGNIGIMLRTVPAILRGSGAV